MTSTSNTRALDDALEASLAYLEAHQDEEGAWPGDYGGPLFLLPLFIATHAMIEEAIPESTRSEMERYIRGQQNHDGGFGLHVEGPSTSYGTSANYVALRILGVPAADPALLQARKFMHARGGPLGSASWGKFFLALLDLYPYEQIAPVPPELWLLPQSAPMHPSKFWCHCRMVYLPMSYLYARRVTWHGRDLQGRFILEELRAELYPRLYSEVDFRGAFERVDAEDNSQPQTRLSRFASRALLLLEQVLQKGDRKAALDYVLHQIDREDKNTDYICIGPINKLLNTLVWHVESPHSPELASHKRRLNDYLYHAEDGVKMQGYNSSKLWDTAFAAQALAELPLQFAETARVEKMLAEAYTFIEAQQVQNDVWDHESAFRHRSKGGWPFSDRPHGWPISDCTAEGLKAALALEKRVPEPIAEERLQDAVRLILSLQNQDGGWATYELQRAGAWLELLNPSDCFRDIMVDYSYVECTSACVSALAQFKKRYPNWLRLEVGRAISRGKEFLLQAQREDGSFEGSWGVCFTYGTYFGVKGLLAAGLDVEHPALLRAKQFLLSRQNFDGGWGESVKNCELRSYENGVESQVVMTSWALLALLALEQHRSVQAANAVAFILSRQQRDGGFPQEKIAGVFNKTCAIHYDNYLKIFPLWALCRYARLTQVKSYARAAE